ncbi:sigma-70 family RNA polymerase sigma factor [Domibacillus robiginosus]|uniref:sigma-70 family RNA polymerase sigma factor n=1 Tax=Domibacillus robiginosus TaxID=1071054 RepID=UPI00067ADB7C|nr:sigma-70 family RNA polymerase sigma factor [Domibacillus robiginosus]
MSKSKFWTEEEDHFLKENLCKMTLEAIGHHLGGRSKESVNKRVIRLKLRTEKTRQRKSWCKEEDLFLAENLNNMKNVEIAERLGRPVNSIATRIKVLKLQRKNPLRRWTAEEDDYMIQRYGKQPISFIAKKLKRTPGAVEGRLNRLGIYGGRSNNGDLTTYDLAAELKVDVHTVYNWIQKYDMPCYEAVIKTRIFTMIEVQPFWKWAEENKERINWSRVSNNTLIPEPEWVQQQRHCNFMNHLQKENRNWTAEEDARLWQMYYSKGYTQKQIGEIMGRSARGVQRRLERLRRAKKVS